MATNSVPNKQGKDKNASRKLEGEGSYTATRRYNEHLASDLQKGNTARGAEEARRAMEGPEASELKRAAEQGKRGPKHSTAKPKERRS